MWGVAHRFLSWACWFWEQAMRLWLVSPKFIFQAIKEEGCLVINTENRNNENVSVQTNWGCDCLGICMGAKRQPTSGRHQEKDAPDATC
mmetsp:Transcript_10883/g.25219  ORF Transcript_10883/g.25219 Transcript_10883/m.25219 type:complete len:89 (-) Transcript_10883:947-1213(-)